MRLQMRCPKRGKGQTSFFVWCVRKGVIQRQTSDQNLAGERPPKKEGGDKGKLTGFLGKKESGS